jgi:hypothetical protein
MWVAGSGESIQLHWNADSSANFAQSTLTGEGRIWGRLRWTGGSETVLLADRFFQSGDNPDLIIDHDTGNVLLASAESKPLGSALRGVDFDAKDTDFGRWFHTIDHAWGGNSQIIPAEFPDVDSAVQTDDLGKYFSWSFRLGDRLVLANNLTTEPWAGIGIRLSKRDLDWSGVKAIRLWVRGSSSRGDSIWLQVSTSAVDRIGGGQFRTAVHLPSGWSTMDIPLDALHMHPPAGSKADSLRYDWNTVKRSVHDIVFYAASPNIKLELREVRAIGARQIHW